LICPKVLTPTLSLARLVGRVVDAPCRLGDGLVRVYVETGPEVRGGIHEILSVDQVGDFLLSEIKLHDHVQVQGTLHTSAGQDEDGLWRYRAHIVAERARKVPAQDQGGPAWMSMGKVVGQVCSEVEVHRPFASKIHPFWLEAVERVYLEVRSPDGPQHVLVSLSEELSAHATVLTRHAPVEVEGDLASGSARDEQGRARRISIVNARLIRRLAGWSHISSTPAFTGRGCSETELELMWSGPIRGPYAERVTSA
jgi:hypothetical protein